MQPNRARMQVIGNLFWGMQFAPFSRKTALNRHQVLFRLFRVKTAQSHTAITSIVIRVANQLRIKRESAIIRHCEANRRFAKAIKKNQSARSAKPCKSFCFVWLLPKVESLYSLVIARFGESPNRSNPQKIK